MERTALTRRSFFRATALTGAAAGLAGAIPGGFVKDAEAAAEKAAKKDETKIVKTLCRACIHNCGVLAHVRNGRIVKLEGNPEYPMSKGCLCPKALAGIQAVYNPMRNKYPMLRVGKRGEGKFRRISWKEAIDLLAKKLMEAKNKWGAESVIVTTGGGGNPAFRGVRRFANAFGTPNFWEPGCAQCFLPRTVAYGLMYGGPTTSIADENSLEIYNPKTPMKSIVLWGTDPSYSCPAGGGQALSTLRAKGVKTVVIDPRWAGDSSHADVWLPIRPGTDVALELGWVNYIIAHKLYDEKFCSEWTNLSYLVNTKTKMMMKATELDPKAKADEYVVLDGKTPRVNPYPFDAKMKITLDGEVAIKGTLYKTGFRLLKERAAEWTLEKTGKVCHLDPKMIEKAIRIYAEGPSGISLGVATDQYEQSVQAAMGSVILNGLMGYVEKPGTLMNRNPNSGVSPAGSLATPASYLLPKGQLKKRLGGDDFKGLYQWDAAQPPAVLKAALTGKPYQPHIWIERSGNKFAVCGNSPSWVAALKKFDFVVHMYMYPTSFSMYADLLLPATEWLETNMLIQSLNMIFARQAVTHTWETEDETLFWAKLGKKLASMGHENMKRACDPKVMGKDLAYWNSMEELLDGRLKNVGLTWKEMLAHHNPYTWMPYDKWNTYGVYLQKDPKTGKPKGFHTHCKKLELYGECFITLGRTGKPFALDENRPVKKDYDPLPYYTEPAESPNRPIAKKYPLVLTSGRVPWFHHGTLRNAPYLRESYPVPELWITPADAKKAGVANGNWAWIESARGKTQGKVRVTKAIPPGVVYMERFWFPETLYTPTHGFREANVNVLTKNDPPYNDVVGTYTLRGFQVRVSKAAGAPKGIWTKPEQFKAWLPKPTDRTKNPEL